MPHELPEGCSGAACLQELVDIARRNLLCGSTATLKHLAEKLETETDVSVPEAALGDAMTRWNANVSKIVGASDTVESVTVNSP